MKKSIILIIACLAMLQAGQIKAEAGEGYFTVGSGENYDYSSVQEAIDATNNIDDTIYIADGVYNENLIISGNKDIVIFGNSLDPTAVVITGTININKKAGATLEYLLIDATDNNYGVKIKGRAIIQRGTLKNAKKYGVLVERGARLTVKKQIIKNNNVDGIWAKKNSKIYITLDSVIKNNNKTGIRAHNTKKLTISEVTFRNNKKGILIRNDKIKNKIYHSNFIKNHAGIYLNSSKTIRKWNSFIDNDVKIKIIN